MESRLRAPLSERQGNPRGPLEILQAMPMPPLIMLPWYLFRIIILAPLMHIQSPAENRGGKTLSMQLGLLAPGLLVTVVVGSAQ